jgi:NhaA family Na+:H+ antiporter
MRENQFKAQSSRLAHFSMAGTKVPARTRGTLHFLARRSPFTRQILLPVESFIHSEIAGAVSLLLAAVVALVWANSPWSEIYFALKEMTATVVLGPISISRDLSHWINDGLMTIFFFVVALEIKRELVHGELSSIRKAALPVAAALGGMIVPVVIFLAINPGGPGARGWGIPMATDIAFALGALALVGPRIPFALRIFLLAYAIVDDIGAIVVIAIFYSGKISLAAVLCSLGVLAFILILRVSGIRLISVYVVLGVILWGAVFESGIHATIAGVILGLLAPSRAWISPAETADELEKSLPHLRAAVANHERERSEGILGKIDVLSQHSEAPAERIERLTHPWVTLLILPLFALANAGVPLSGASAGAALTSRVALGVAAGLLLGKFIGLTTFAWAAVRLRLADLPNETSWRHLLGAALLGGIGFTVAIFVSNLAYSSEEMANAAKIAILFSSLVAAIAGWVFLRFASSPGRSFV